MSGRPEEEARREEEERRDLFLAWKRSLPQEGRILDQPGEPLACPRCERLFAFGAQCPECHILLVQASFLGKASADEPYYRSNQTRWRSLALALLAGLGAIGMVIWLWWKSAGSGYPFW